MDSTVVLGLVIQVAFRQSEVVVFVGLGVLGGDAGDDLVDFFDFCSIPSGVESSRGDEGWSVGNPSPWEFGCWREVW